MNLLLCHEQATSVVVVVDVADGLLLVFDVVLVTLAVGDDDRSSTNKIGWLSSPFLSDPVVVVFVGNCGGDCVVDVGVDGVIAESLLPPDDAFELSSFCDSLFLLRFELPLPPLLPMLFCDGCLSISEDKRFLVAKIELLKLL